MAREADNAPMLTLISVISGLAAFEVLALRYGADSRRGFDERPDFRQNLSHSDL